MELKKSNLFASDTRRTYVRHEGGEIGHNCLFCKENRVSDTHLASQKLSWRLPNKFVLTIQHEDVRREVTPSE